ncbi:uncharacterized protein B0H18DRAFT_870202, partial [Fomitopsis serialis]|uniref:uncharacterized protein n=1 Tax=Fomitopsis serialis TaxID=139415 RepID=UPI002007F63D
YALVIAQYKRGHYGVGDEESFHWALVVIAGEHDLSGPMYQVTNRINHTRDGVAWDISYADSVSLMKSSMCLGGVRIGTIMKSDLKEFKKIVAGNTPQPDSDQWNCRDWIMQCLRLLEGKGWLSDGIRTQQDLFPLLKQASLLTVQNGTPATLKFSPSRSS